MNERFEELRSWLRDGPGLEEGFAIAPASSDASFRRYYRVSSGGVSYIAMDAPTDKEDSHPFVAVAQAMAGLGLNVPRILAADLERGFLLLSDLGSRHYLQALNEQSVAELYEDALAALRLLQSAPLEGSGLPDYGRDLLLREMGLFRDWYIARHLGIRVDEEIDETLSQSFDFLVREALMQPRVWVHRDYHSRNLMVTTENNPGILDFQDAAIGPVTYDVVSLLRDCYVAWPDERVTKWVKDYFLASRADGLLQEVEEEQFMRWFDFMGIQRHLKAVGIFARLKHRDAKPGYLSDIPRTLAYIVAVSGRYPELHSLHQFLENKVLPHSR